MATGTFGNDAPELAEALATLGNGRGLSEEMARDAFSAIVDGRATEPQIAALLTALRVKGETVEELAGAVGAIRERMSPFDSPRRPILDTCGTGGDGSSSVNISTASAIVAAASGAAVAKHGNRSASGVSGSSDVLDRLGVAIAPDLAILQRCLGELGITFLFAPNYHPALRHAANVRRQLPFRTAFNLVGPLANPSRPEYQLVGVPNEHSADLMAGALRRLGVLRAAVVTGEDGLDEVSLDAPTRVLWIESGRIEPRTWTPSDFDLPRVSASELRVTGPDQSAELLRAMLDGANGPVRHVVLANTAAALLVSGLADALPDGVRCAAEAIDSGAARELLRRWASLSNGGGPRVHPPAGSR